MVNTELDPEIKAIVDAANAGGRPAFNDLTPAEAKLAYKAMRKLFETPDLPDVAKRDVEARGPAGPIPLRIYRPKARGDAILPALIFYHGGGFTIGDIETHDGVCQALCQKGQFCVVSVDYRLAPEHKFPAAVDDSFAALQWVSANADALGIDASRLAVGGDSAGGCLAAVTALLARDQGGPELRLQLLIYPTTDFAHDLASHQKHARGKLLTIEALYYFRNLYLNDLSEIGDWRASPLRAADHGRLPPAWLLTAGHDPLEDEGLNYAAKLEASGVPVTRVDYPGQVHGFITMGKVIPQARHAIDAAATALAQAFQH